MIWFCESICWFFARCARSGSASGSCLCLMVRQRGLLSCFFVRLFDRKIFVRGVGVSLGSRNLLLRTTLDRLGSSYEDTGRQCDALRCRLITEVQVSSGFENRAETSEFHSADFLSGSETSAEPVVLSRACDAYPGINIPIQAPIPNIQEALRRSNLILIHHYRIESKEYARVDSNH